MKLLVSDANVLIDVAAGGIIDRVFRIPDFELCVPNVLFAEELAEQYPLLPSLGLQVLNMRGDLVMQAVALRREFRQTSVDDLLALVLAEDLKCPLLTGDRALRHLARQRGNDVHGTIWIVRQLLEASLISVSKGEAAFESMRADGSRLPWVEAYEMLADFR